MLDCRLLSVRTSLKADEWAVLLRDHPDEIFVDYLIHGITFWFRIGYNREGKIQPSRRNMKSVAEDTAVVSDYLRQEMERGYVLCPFDLQGFGSTPIQTSRIGVIPKKWHSYGKWRLVVDLSSPDGASVNDGIDPALCSLSYTRVDQVAEKVSELGVGTQLAKIDVQSAYRIVPVHPDDHLVLGMRWRDRLYVDASLPFGLRSAPKLFDAIADALEWIAPHLGMEFLWHYLRLAARTRKSTTSTFMFSARIVVD